MFFVLLSDALHSEGVRFVVFSMNRKYNKNGDKWDFTGRHSTA